MNKYQNHYKFLYKIILKIVFIWKAVTEQEKKSSCKHLFTSQGWPNQGCQARHPEPHRDSLHGQWGTSTGVSAAIWAHYQECGGKQGS